MKLRVFLILINAIVFTRINAQTYVGVKQTSISQTQVNQNINLGPSDGAIKYAVDAFLFIYSDSRKMEIEKEKSAARQKIISEEYNSYPEYPDSIVNGWHHVLVTDNHNFCNDAKVFVENNRIERFVIDDCFPLSFVASGSIRKAKNMVTLNYGEGMQSDFVEVIFLYDIEEPRVVNPPIAPGYVTFWTTSNKFIGQRISINNRNYSGVPMAMKYTLEAKCNEAGTRTLMLKPGSYSFTAYKKGNDHEGVIEIKSDECLIYKLY